MQGSMCLVGLLVEDGWLKTHQVLQVLIMALLKFLVCWLVLCFFFFAMICILCKRAFISICLYMETTFSVIPIDVVFLDFFPYL